MRDETAKSVLIVEDYPDDAAMLTSVLQQTGVGNSIELVHNANDAIAYLRGSIPYADRARFPVPAVILLDLKLPGMDGFSFLEWLKGHEEFNDILVVAVSGLGDLASIRRAYALGADSFLTKPCRVEDVANLIQWFPDFWTPAAHSFSARSDDRRF